MTRLAKAERAVLEAARHAFDAGPLGERMLAWLRASRELVDAIAELPADERPTTPELEPPAPRHP